jgi:hypothetical protein
VQRRNNVHVEDDVRACERRATALTGDPSSGAMTVLDDGMVGGKEGRAGNAVVGWRTGWVARSDEGVRVAGGGSGCDDGDRGDSECTDGECDRGAFDADRSDGTSNGRRRAISTSGDCISMWGAVVFAGRHCSAICRRGRAELRGSMSDRHIGSYITGQMYSKVGKYDTYLKHHSAPKLLRAGPSIHNVHFNVVVLNLSGGITCVDDVVVAAVGL